MRINWGPFLSCFYLINWQVFVQKFSKFFSQISDPPKTIVQSLIHSDLNYTNPQCATVPSVNKSPHGNETTLLWRCEISALLCQSTTRYPSSLSSAGSKQSHIDKFCGGVSLTQLNYCSHTLHSAEKGVSYSAIWQKKIMQLRKSGGWLGNKSTDFW